MEQVEHASARERGFRDLGAPVALLSGALVLFAAATIAAMIYITTGPWPTPLVGPVLYVEETMTLGDLVFEQEVRASMDDLLTLIKAALFTVCAVLFSWFSIRSNRNSTALGASHMNYSPAAMVYWYFVPFANLVKPYAALSEVWDSSVPKSEANNFGSPGIFKAWWAAWIIGLTVLNLAAQAAQPDFMFMEPERPGSLYIAGNLMMVLAALLTMLVARRVRDRQRECLADLAGPDQ